MNFLKEFKIVDGIYSFNITSDTTNLVKDFYFDKPFPSYSSEDDKYSILKKGNDNYLSKSVKKKNWKFKIYLGSRFGYMSTFIISCHRN